MDGQSKRELSRSCQRHAEFAMWLSDSCVVWFGQRAFGIQILEHTQPKCNVLSSVSAGLSFWMARKCPGQGLGGSAIEGQSPRPVSPKPGDTRTGQPILHDLGSEVKLEPELHLARADRRRRDGPEVSIIHRSVRGPKNRVVKGILGLDAEFEVHLLAYAELLADGQIGCEVRRTAETAYGSRSVPQSVIGGTHEIGVDVRVVTRKVIVYPIRPIVALWRSHDIWPQRLTSAAIGGN